MCLWLCKTKLIQKMNVMGDSIQNPCCWHCEWEFWVSAFCYGASFAVGFGVPCSTCKGSTPVGS